MALVGMTTAVEAVAVGREVGNIRMGSRNGVDGTNLRQVVEIRTVIGRERRIGIDTGNVGTEIEVGGIVKTTMKIGNDRGRL